MSYTSSSNSSPAEPHGSSGSSNRVGGGGKTHRTRLARALAADTGVGYQKCLHVVVSVADAGLLPAALDADGMMSAVRVLGPLVEMYAGGAGRTSLAKRPEVLAASGAARGRGRLLSVPACAPTGRRWTFKDLVGNGSLTAELACELAWLVGNRANIMVAGGTGSGKTSLLNALVCCIPRAERVVAIEDARELRWHPASQVASMVPGPVLGGGRERVGDLVQQAMRMRPDRIVVGEIQDGAAHGLLQAMSTGHHGSMFTVHVSGAEPVVRRLTALAADDGGVSKEAAQRLVGDALDIVVVMRNYDDGVRRVQGIYEVPRGPFSAGGAQPSPAPLWEWMRTGTSEDGRHVGDYVKGNEISDGLVRLRRLDRAERVSLGEVFRLSDFGT